MITSDNSDHERIIADRSKFLDQDYFPHRDKREARLSCGKVVKAYQHQEPNLPTDTGFQFVDALLERGQAYLGKGDTDAAMRDFEEAHSLITLVMGDEQECDDGNRLWCREDESSDEKIELSVPLFCRLWIGRCQFARNEFQKAGTEFRHILGDIEGRIWDLLERDWDAPIESPACLVDFDLYAQAFYWLARATEAQGDLKEAVHIYTQALRYAPRCRESLLGRGRLLFRMQEKGEVPSGTAIADVIEAIWLAPTQFSAYFDLVLMLLAFGDLHKLDQFMASSYSYTGSQYDEGVKDVCEAVRTVMRDRSGTMAAPLGEGARRLARECRGSASHILAKLVALDSSKGVWHFMLGVALSVEGKVAESREEFLHATTLSPTSCAFRYALAATDPNPLMETAIADELRTASAKAEASHCHVVPSEKTSAVQDSRRVAAIRPRDGDRTIHSPLWTTGEPHVRISDLPSQVRSMSLSERYGLLAIGFSDGSISLRSIPSGRELQNLTGTSSQSIAFVNGGDLLACTSDNKVVLWDVQSGSKAYELRHDGAVVDIVAPVGTSKLLTIVEGGSRRLWAWELDTFSLEWTLPFGPTHGNPVMVRNSREEWDGWWFRCTRVIRKNEPWIDMQVTEFWRVRNARNIDIWESVSVPFSCEVPYLDDSIIGPNGQVLADVFDPKTCDEKLEMCLYKNTFSLPGNIAARGSEEEIDDSLYSDRLEHNVAVTEAAFSPDGRYLCGFTFVSIADAVDLDEHDRQRRTESLVRVGKYHLFDLSGQRHKGMSALVSVSEVQREMANHGERDAPFYPLAQPVFSEGSQYLAIVSGARSIAIWELAKVFGERAKEVSDIHEELD
jgi:tetratricopeptide (TPR) repeat protein